MNSIFSFCYFNLSYLTLTSPDLLKLPHFFCCQIRIPIFAILDIEFHFDKHLRDFYTQWIKNPPENNFFKAILIFICKRAIRKGSTVRREVTRWGRLMRSRFVLENLSASKELSVNASIPVS